MAAFVDSQHRSSLPQRIRLPWPTPSIYAPAGRLPSIPGTATSSSTQRRLVVRRDYYILIMIASYDDAVIGS
jgi:hypothetical protein